jgi:hypothetical protein
MNMVTDPTSAVNFIASGGMPIKAYTSGGKISKVQMEHVWVEGYVPYGPYSGRPSKLNPPKTWIPLDPSYKQYTYTEGIDLQTAVPFDATSFVNQIKSTATINETEGYVTNVDSNYVQTTLTNYQTQVQDYITQNMPTATVGDVLGKKAIKKQDLGILPATLPYKTIQIGSKFSEVSSTYRASINFSIPDQFGLDTGLAYSTTLPQIAGKKITLSFSPATANDQAIIESYLPKTHADGSPIQPNELPSSLPAYLINLKPELYIDGQKVATGASIAMGQPLSFSIALNEPNIGTSYVNNTITAGEYFGIGLDTGRIASGNLTDIKTRLESTKTKLETQNFEGITKDDILGDLLHATMTAYFAELDTTDEILSKTMGIVRARIPSLGMFSLAIDTHDIFGVPVSAGASGFKMDVDRIMQVAIAKDGNKDTVKQYMLSSGATSSALEHSVPEQLFSTPESPAQGISAIKALKLANDQGIPIYTINQSNISTILPQLQISQDVKSDIQNAVNAGKEVTVSKTNITFNGWIGAGYIIIDPNTGAGAYMISGGQSGSFLMAMLLLLTGLFLLAIAVAAVPVPIALVIVSLLMPFYLAFLAWLAAEASSEFRACVAAVAASVLAAIIVRNILVLFAISYFMRTIVNTIRAYTSAIYTGMECFGSGLSY